MDIYHTIIRPLVTEKGTHQSQVSHEETRTRPARGGAYTFEVHPKANKAQIRQAIEKIYNVKVHVGADVEPQRQAPAVPDDGRADPELEEGGRGAAPGLPH